MKIGDRVLVKRQIGTHAGRVKTRVEIVYDEGVVLAIAGRDATVKLTNGIIVTKPKRTVFVDPR